MKKKHWIVIIIIVALAAIALVLYYCLRPTWYHAERIDPRTLHTSPAHQEMMLGLWQHDNHLFYRFNANSTGLTWDVNDDMSEEEATPFEWEAYDNALMLSHKMLLRGIVPRYYHLDILNAYDLRFHDAYSSYVLERVDEKAQELAAEQVEALMEE